MLILETLLRNWWMVLSGIACTILVAGWFYIQHVRSQVAELSGKLVVQQQVNSANLAALDELKNQYAANLAAVTADRDAVARRADTVAKLKEDSRHEDDAPVAPVLRSVLDGLRKQSSS